MAVADKNRHSLAQPGKKLRRVLGADKAIQKVICNRILALVLKRVGIDLLRQQKDAVFD